MFKQLLLQEKSESKTIDIKEQNQNKEKQKVKKNYLKNIVSGFLIYLQGNKAQVEQYVNEYMSLEEQELIKIKEFYQKYKSKKIKITNKQSLQNLFLDPEQLPLNQQQTLNVQQISKEQSNQNSIQNSTNTPNYYKQEVSSFKKIRSSQYKRKKNLQLNHYLKYIQDFPNFRIQQNKVNYCSSLIQSDSTVYKSNLNRQQTNNNSNDQIKNSSQIKSEINLLNSNQLDSQQYKNQNFQSFFNLDTQQQKESKISTELDITKYIQQYRVNKIQHEEKDCYKDINVQQNHKQYCNQNTFTIKVEQEQIESGSLFQQLDEQNENQLKKKGKRTKKQIMDRYYEKLKVEKQILRIFLKKFLEQEFNTYCIRKSRIKSYDIIVSLKRDFVQTLYN
ncbi:hypothetical protein PPERSA_07947 [Pseudocohnilembus persalinus]|uniref:Uncharacterized protein n=1 Tax=Pseudocohnilembus persalinus TaxID=266149 RepID=A0A0V0QB50_PSEPJ|nr:hypothetical protein PPERSA_07947 [Pseudocohnilembus persalinus]|eukprot:KRW99462.1 hypothetical protein PPERSA_07947 [Pseudocohnilembus persalinus]